MSTNTNTAEIPLRYFGVDAHLCAKYEHEPK